MNKIQKFNEEKATVCSNKNCVTVYGDTARIINMAACVAVFLILGVVVVKAFNK